MWEEWVNWEAWEEWVSWEAWEGWMSFEERRSERAGMSGRNG